MYTLILDFQLDFRLLLPLETLDELLPLLLRLPSFIPKAFVSPILIKLLSYLISFHVLLCFFFLLPPILSSLSFLPSSTFLFF